MKERLQTAMEFAVATTVRREQCVCVCVCVCVCERERERWPAW